VTVVVWRSGTTSSEGVTENMTTSDARGLYRIGGLAPGAYHLAAVPPSVARVGAPPSSETEIDSLLSQLRRGIRSGFLRYGKQDQPPKTALGVTYYPGTTAVTSVGEIQLSAGEEATATNVVLLREQLADLRVTFLTPPGVTVSMIDAEIVIRGLPPKATRVTSIRQVRLTKEVVAAISGVPPGAYVLIGRAGVVAGADRVTTLWGMTNVNVSPGQLDIFINLGEACRVVGRVTHDLPTDPRSTPWRAKLIGRDEDARRSTITRQPDAPIVNGQFAFAGVPAGSYDLVIEPDSRGDSTLSVTAATVDGRDVLDSGLDLLPGSNANVMVTIGEHGTVFSGTVHAPAGVALSDYRVVVYPASQALWPSFRRTASAPVRPDGRFELRHLPEGSYLFAVVSGDDESDLPSATLLQTLIPFSLGVELKKGQAATRDVWIK
jgi:hypothetical protein